MTQRARRYRLPGGSCLPAMILAVAVQPAHAQPADPATSATLDSSSVLEEIIVTAQKRVENAQTVPISISTLSASQLANQKITNVIAIASQVPNLQIATPYSEAVPVFSLRGISAVDYAQNQSSPVALYVDEVYKGLGVLTSLQIFDIDRLEVLRGPQGTLYGKNTPGGAINFYTKQPSFDAGFSGDVTAGVGRFDRREASGGVNIPIAEGVLAARAAFTVAKADGFVKNVSPGLDDQGSIDDWAYRLSLAFRPTDTFDMLLRFTSSESTPTGFGNIADDIGAGGVFFTPGYTREQLDFFENQTDKEGLVRIENRSIALTTTWDVSGAAALTAVTSYDEGSWLTFEDADNTPFDLVTNTYFSDAEAYSQDLRIASTGSGAFKWLVGAYFYRDRVQSQVKNRFLFEYAGDGDGNGQNDCFDDFFTGCAYGNDFQQTRESYALYTQESFELAEGWTLTAGLRYTRDENRLDRYRSDATYFDPALQQELFAFPVFEEPSPGVSPRKDDKVSGKLGLDYQLSDRTLLYGSLSRGYRGSSFNGLGQFSQDEVNAVDPEELDALELGVKTQTDDNRLRVNASAFYYDYQNQQFLTTVGVVVQLSSGDSRLWGGEIEVTAQPVSSFGLRLGASYLDSKYTDLVLSNVRQDGNELIAAPKWTLNAGFDWTLIDASAGALTLYGASRYTSKQFYDGFNAETAAQDGYFLHDARLTFETAQRGLALSAWIRNIADKEYTPFRIDVQSAFNLTYSHRGRPREFGVEATYRF